MGVKGGLHIGGVGGDVVVYITETQQLLYGALDNINLQTIVDAILSDFGVKSPPGIIQVHLRNHIIWHRTSSADSLTPLVRDNLQTITDVSFRQVSLYVNDGAAITYMGTVYPPGFAFSIQDLDLWEIIKGSAYIAVSDTNVLVNATLQPINILNGAIVLSGAHSKNDPAILYLNIGEGHTPVSIMLSCP